jgi:hypothetical protein
MPKQLWAPSNFDAQPLWGPFRDFQPAAPRCTGLQENYVRRRQSLFSVFCSLRSQYEQIFKENRLLRQGDAFSEISRQ